MGMVRNKKTETDKTIKAKKKQIGVQIDEVLWRKFRARCMEDGITAGAKIEEFIQEELTLSTIRKEKVALEIMENAQRELDSLNQPVDMDELKRDGLLTKDGKYYRCKNPYDLSDAAKARLNCISTSSDKGLKYELLTKKQIEEKREILIDLSKNI